jgi:hypothetical protein
MQDLDRLLLAIVATFGCALAAPLLGVLSRGRPAGWVGWCYAPAIMACPLLIPADRVKLRAAAVFLATDVALKVVDFWRHRAGPGRGGGLRDYLRFLVPFPALSVVYPDHKRRLAHREPPGPQVVRVVAGSMGVVAGLVLLGLISGAAPLRSHPALGHAVVLVLFVVTVESLSRASCGLERLAGFDTTPIIRDAYVSRTVTEFWRRYNDRVHDWFYRNVFRPAGGRRAPIRATVLVFLVSGLLHEAVFGIATSRFDGTQLAFFLLQAPAALASGRFERLARRGGIAGKVAAHGSTIVFLYATSFLFFRGVSRIFPVVNASGMPAR